MIERKKTRSRGGLVTTPSVKKVVVVAFSQLSELIRKAKDGAKSDDISSAYLSVAENPEYPARAAHGPRCSSKFFVCFQSPGASPEKVLEEAHLLKRFIAYADEKYPGIPYEDIYVVGGEEVETLGSNTNNFIHVSVMSKEKFFSSILEKIRLQ